MPHVYPYDFRHDLPFDELKGRIGGKAAGLNAMALGLGLPVPPAFVITTATCNEFLATGWPAGLDEEIREHMARLEAIVGRRFGDAADPLLVSVRSGAPISMPGMMETILNLGLNHATEAGLAAASGDPEFARNCHDRFHALYRDVVGTDVVPVDPWDQLRGAIEAVLRSWNGDKAKTYREHEGIPDTLGTGVVVQAMVFGNLGDDSGTGVLFTRNPATGEAALYGDVVFRGQGEDVVAGTHDTLPVSCLEDRMPAVAAELHRYADVLERHYADARDIEFTIERGRLWMLQDRTAKRTPQAAVRMAVEMAEEPGFPLTREQAVERVKALLADPPRHQVQEDPSAVALATGLGASPGVVAGEIALTPEAAVTAHAGGRRVILVRAETSPDDVHGMEKSCGILTSTGGFASHAAVVARGWGIPAVVGATAVVPGTDSVRVGERMLPAGTVITIDGSTGEVFEGVAAGVEEVAPEARVLLAWAAELGIAIPSADGEAPAHEAVPAPAEVLDATAAPTPEDALRAMLVRDFLEPRTLGAALCCDPAAAATLLEALTNDGLAKASAGASCLTPEGREVATALLAADAAAWGRDAASAALDEFVDFDRRMKQVVTSWQMREVNGAQAPNDHADAAYDASVRESLGALHVDVEAWMRPLVAALPRLGLYARRLALAAANAAKGDGKYIASPRVDSYHGAWFELHEDLIQLAGRTRSDEVVAGRA